METITKFPTAADLAAEFIKVLNEWLKPSEIEEINRRNATPEYGGGACATHDFCDPNQAMLDAWTNLTEQDLPMWNDEEGNKKEAEKATDLVNEAWDISRAQKFTKQVA